MSNTDLLVATALVGVLVVVGLALVAYTARRREPTPSRSLPALGLSAGLLLGAALGTIVWLSTGEFVFWVIFMGGGMVIGLALGSATASKPG